MSATIPNASLTFVQLFTIIFSGTFGLMGLIFLVVGVAFDASLNRKRSQCTTYAEGTVCAMQSQFGTTGLRAVYSFSIDGKPMQYVSNYSGKNNLLVGQSVSVYYDPEQIGRVYIEEDARQMHSFARVFLIVGGAFLAVALIIAVVLLGI
ncbi:MAG: DUF3592 domain-containing protein [Eubacteriales bacterium]|nr:DUF3592 domain-containing protein [Eubacteriales bacterium]